MGMIEEYITKHESTEYGDSIGYVQPLVRCKDCKMQECEGRNGMIVCDITGESHSPDWFCADGVKKDG